MTSVSSEMTVLTSRVASNVSTSTYAPSLPSSPSPQFLFTHQEVKPRLVLPLKPVDLQSGPYRIILVSGKGGYSHRIYQNLLALRLITAVP